VKINLKLNKIYTEKIIKVSKYYRRDQLINKMSNNHIQCKSNINHKIYKMKKMNNNHIVCKSNNHHKAFNIINLHHKIETNLHLILHL
jgi:hypothetical protein